MVEGCRRNYEEACWYQIKVHFREDAESHHFILAAYSSLLYSNCFKSQDVLFLDNEQLTFYGYFYLLFILYTFFNISENSYFIGSCAQIYCFVISLTSLQVVYVTLCALYMPQVSLHLYVLILQIIMNNNEHSHW